MKNKIFLITLSFIAAAAFVSCGKSSVSDVSLQSYDGFTLACIHYKDAGMTDMKTEIMKTMAYCDSNNVPMEGRRVVTVMWSWKGGKGEWGTGIVVDPSLNLQSSGDIEIISFPPLTDAATLTYTGPYFGLMKGYSAMNKWLADNHYAMGYPNFEEYLNDPQYVKPSELKTLIWTPFNPAE